MVVNPNDATTVIATWVGAVVIVAAVIASAVTKITGSIKSIITDIQDIRSSLRHTNDRVHAIALATPAVVTIPAPPPASETNSVTVTETTTPPQ